MVNAKSANDFAEVRTLRLCKKTRTVRSFNKTKTLTCWKSAFCSTKKANIVRLSRRERLVFRIR